MSGFFAKLPQLRIAFAHGGGAFPGLLGRISHGFDVRPDICAVDHSIPPKEYLDRIYVDSLVHSPQCLRLLMETFGENKIALGTDYPFPLGELSPGKLIENMDFDQRTRERLFHGTALEWLGVSAERFQT